MEWITCAQCHGSWREGQREDHYYDCPNYVASVADYTVRDPATATKKAFVSLRNGQYQCHGCGKIVDFGQIGQHVCGERENPNARSVLLDEAGALIDGQRAKDYGSAAENFTRIANGWAEIVGAPVTAAQVALCMDWVKTCRLITSPNHRDSWVDKLGYGALGGEIAL